MNTSRIEEFAARLGDVLEEADGLLAAAASKASEVPEATQEGLRAAREHLEAACRSVHGRVRALDKSVHENPWRAIAATGLVAFALGLLVRRR